MQGSEDDLMDTSEFVPSKPSGCSLINVIANHVFEDIPNLCGESSTSSKNIKDIWKNVNKYLEGLSNTQTAHKWGHDQRLGPPTVHFSRKKCVGNFEFKDKNLEICSKDNFSTIFADTCVFKGKWQYEVMLGSKGVMQVGWATLNCEFSEENGVGDTPNSYAYDGNRQRKWNVATNKYGEMWHCGDIISCTIDLDKGKLSYFRNGRSLGVAFDNVKTGPGVAYFPALSLAIDESLVANFGETPFCYPQEEFQPLQAPPLKQLTIATKCLEWLSHLVNLSIHWNEYAELIVAEKERLGNKRVALMVVAQHLGMQLAPVISFPYVVEDVLIPVLQKLADSAYEGIGSSEASNSCEYSEALLRYLIAILQEEEKKAVFDTIVMCLQRRFRQISLTIDYRKQKSALRLLHLILSESQVRKFCLQNVLFEKESHYRLISFVAIKCIDKICFKNMANIDFWSSKDGEFCCGDKEFFHQTVGQLEVAVQELEDLQISVLKLLFRCDDAQFYNATSRALLLKKLRNFLKEQLIGSRVTVTSFVLPTAILSLFNCCLHLFFRLWGEEVEENLGESTMPPALFFDGRLEYFDVQRLGGLDSHLKKKFCAEREQALKEISEARQLLNPIVSSKNCPHALSRFDSCPPSTSGTVLGELLLTDVESVSEKLQRVNVEPINFELEQKRSKEELRTSLLHFLDGVILLYHHGGHKQIERIVTQSDVFFDNVTHLEELIKKKEKCLLTEHEVYSGPVLYELNRSVSVLESKLKDQSYQHAWNTATLFSVDYIRRIQLLLKIILGALKESSKMEGLFTFVPDFYVETLTQLCQDLRHLILCNQENGSGIMDPPKELKLVQRGGKPLPLSLSEEYQDLLMKVGEFLALHFSDSRIVFADSKDSLIQALAGFVCHRPGLEVLERMPLESRLEMVKSLLQPYENRAWAQNNWILVRFWKGKGYGFRFTKSPHLSNKLGPKPAHCEIPNVILSSAPYFSEVFLMNVSETLQKTEISTPFLNSLLNQLNWVFSEFIGMLQEIQNASNRPERVFIDSRQLRICATCFDLALALLRVLEMIVNVSANIFLDAERQDSKPLLTRLCQLLCQILNRVSIGTGCFSHVVNLEIPGLETIHYFPILTAVIGIICQLLKDEIYTNKDPRTEHSATKTLLEEASFQMCSLFCLVGGKTALKPLNATHSETAFDSSLDSQVKVQPTPANCTSVDHLFTSQCECKQPKFCLRKYPADVLNYEIHKLVDAIHHLETTATSFKMQQSLVEDSDKLCTICYARTSDATFMPCGHSSCTTCITHYLMNRSVCFFCKSPISQVKDTCGKFVYTSSAS